MARCSPHQVVANAATDNVIGTSRPNPVGATPPANDVTSWGAVQDVVFVIARDSAVGLVASSLGAVTGGHWGCEDGSKENQYSACIGALCRDAHGLPPSWHTYGCQ